MHDLLSDSVDFIQYDFKLFIEVGCHDVHKKATVKKIQILLLITYF